MADASIHTEQSYRWSRSEYDRAVEAGAFAPDARAELLEGHILAMAPQGSRHATGVALAGEALRSAFGAGCHIRIQLPLAAGDDSEPEPDAAVVEGDIRNHLDAHPAAALLVVEVADDSLRRDRTIKQRIYARSGIREYWLVAVPDERLEVYRDPSDDGYHTISMHRAGDAVAPLARPAAAIAVDDLLP